MIAARWAAVLVALAACGKKETKQDRRAELDECKRDAVYAGPQAEIAGDKVRPDLPAIPSFDLPEPYPDGSRSVKELRVDGRRLLGQQLAVRGRVAWIYDCFAATRAREDHRDRTDAQIRKAIEEEPDRYCHKPEIRIGDADGVALERTLRVVMVPRHPTKVEKKLLPDEELSNPDIWRPVPPLAIGDEVIVTGTFEQRAPSRESDAAGLLVYGGLTNLTQGWPK